MYDLHAIITLVTFSHTLNPLHDVRVVVKETLYMVNTERIKRDIGVKSI